MEKQIVKTNHSKSISPAVPLAIALGSILLMAGTMALIGYLNNRKEGAGEGESASTSSDETEGNSNLSDSLVKSSASEAFRCKSKTYPLQYGTCHPDVMVLQRYMKRKGAELGATGKFKDGIDGEFGTLTLNAARKYINKENFNPQDMLTIRKQLQTT